MPHAARLCGPLTQRAALAAYDFHVNVCANVAHKPPICTDKPDAPGYQARPTWERLVATCARCSRWPPAQVVVPKAVEEDEDESTDFYADDDSYFGAGDEDGGRAADDAALERWRKRQAEPVRRAARAAPEPTECHALGSLDNVTWGLIVPGKPELGLELRYSGGDNCLKRVVKKRQAGDPPPTSALPEVSWVPVPRQLTLRMRCDPAAPAAIDPFDPAAVMQLARRVRIVEAEMCVYEAEWPTAAACPTMKPRVAAVVAAKARRAVFPAVLVLGLLAAVVTQAARHRRTLRALARRVRAGDTGALRAVIGVLAAKVRELINMRYAIAVLTRCCARPARMRRRRRSARAATQARATRSDSRVTACHASDSLTRACHLSAES